MRSNFGERLQRLVWAFGSVSLALSFLSLGNAQQAAPPAAPAIPAQPVREQVRSAAEAARDAAQSARETAQSGRETTRDAASEARRANQDTRDSVRDATRDIRQQNQENRETGRDAVRDNRQETRDTRGEARDTTRDARGDVRDARGDIRQARREFRAERIRSGDLGLWLRRAADRLLVSDLATSGAIVQTGLKEGDQIISVNGQHVASEREFVDRLFANQDNNQPIAVVVSRNGQQQTIQIQPKTFVDEYTVGDTNSLHQYGIIIDDSVPDHLKVKAVVPRSPAFYAGVRSGDEITGLRGERIKQIADLVRGLATSAGASTQLDVNRNNQSRQLDIDIPQDTASEPRTALRPNYDAATPTQPQRNPAQPQADPAQPQGNRAQPQSQLQPRQQLPVAPQNPAAPSQPRLNPPR